MTVPSRRVWRAGRPTLLIVGIFAGVIGIALPVLAYLIYRRERTPWLPAVLVLLAALALLYAWRYGLHPKIWTRGHVLRIDNPWRRYEFDWDDITLIAPGENGLVVASDDQVAEAWCVQKSTAATKKGRYTRADRIASSLHDTLELYHPPISDEETGLRIRRARPHESAVLTRIERATSKLNLAKIFPADQFPYPTDAVAKRWRQLLHDRSSRVHILEWFDKPVGYVAFNADTVLHLGVDPKHQRRGYGSALLEFASLEIFDAGIAEAHAWVLVDNHTARAFYRSHGWQETAERRYSKWPPRPQELKIVRRNPSAPRRSR
ncbi:MAG TPA: GNAT family N-acetyltransferase [Propionibacteriaceae bacterium]|nr:GNAT family N-acetyltransferase [Propionibacteriaceae bacterium]